jgi:hypothetical protein
MPGGRAHALSTIYEEAGGPPPVEVTAGSIGLVQHEPLRAHAADALAQGEKVLLLVGTLEDGARVETLVFTPSGRAAQTTGHWVFSGLWNGAQVLTLNGHALDRDGTCFCRACELANGIEQADED